MDINSNKQVILDYDEHERMLSELKEFEELKKVKYLQIISYFKMHYYGGNVIYSDELSIDIDCPEELREKVESVVEVYRSRIEQPLLKEFEELKKVKYVKIISCYNQVWGYGYINQTTVRESNRFSIDVDCPDELQEKVKEAVKYYKEEIEAPLKEELDEYKKFYENTKRELAIIKSKKWYQIWK